MIITQPSAIKHILVLNLLMRTAFFLLKLIIILFFLGCQPKEFEKNTRILITGSVVDQNNSPIDGASIQVLTDDEVGSIFNIFPFVPTANQIFNLASTQTNQLGEFSVVSLLNRSNNFIVSVDKDDNYAPYLFRTSVLDYTPNNLTFNLNSISLKEKSNFDLILINQNPSSNITITFNYEIPFCAEIYEEGILQEDVSYCYPLETFTVSLQGEDFSRSFISTSGSGIQISYSINSQPEIVETIILNQSENVVTITY